MWGWWWGWLVLIMLILLLVVLKVSFWRRGGPLAHAWAETPDGILRRRLAAGEITEEEFRKLREVVKQ